MPTFSLKPTRTLPGIPIQSFSKLSLIAINHPRYPQVLTTIIGILATTTIAAVGWSIAIASDVKVLDQRHKDIIELINSRFGEMDRRLSRIETVCNGYLPKH